MRFHLIGLVLMAGIAVPAVAQRTESVDRRLERIEQELRAVQRRVFPGANGAMIGPEMEADARVAAPAGVPASSAAADINARLDAMEGQLRTLTGQAEQNANRLRAIEDGLAQLRQATGTRLDALERAGSASARTVTETAPPANAPDSLPNPGPIRQPSRAAAQPSRNAAPAPAAASPASSAASPRASAEAEAAYNAGFHLWEQKRYAEAQQALEQAARAYPDSKWASWSRNLAGRAYLDAGRPATAAKTFLANYQDNPKGERAADSLYFLGQSLVALNKPADACKAYDELQDVYGATMRTWLKQQLPPARAEAKCR
jgi:TolA-binding protein